MRTPHHSAKAAHILRTLARAMLEDGRSTFAVSMLAMAGKMAAQYGQLPEDTPITDAEWAAAYEDSLKVGGPYGQQAAEKILSMVTRH